MNRDSIELAGTRKTEISEQSEVAKDFWKCERKSADVDVVVESIDAFCGCYSCLQLHHFLCACGRMKGSFCGNFHCVCCLSSEMMILLFREPAAR